MPAGRLRAYVGRSVLSGRRKRGTRSGCGHRDPL